MDEANDYCKDNNKMDDAMLIYHEMNEKGFKPNCVTYNRMIQSCFLAERFEDAHKLLDDVLAQGQTLYTNTYCDILHDLLEKELLVEALSLYDDVKSSNLDSSKVVFLSVAAAVITALCSDNPDKTMMDDALKLYQEMVSQPDVVTYNSLVSGLCKIRHWAKAYFLLKELLDKDISPDVETFNILISTICCEGRLQVMDEANDYCKDDKKMDDAMLIYHEMNEKGFKPNCVTYNRMIQSCFSADRFGDAHKLLDDVLAQGQTLYTNTYYDILHDLLQKELLADALSLYDLLGEDSKLNSNTSVIEVLLDGLFDCGELDFVRELFEGLSARGIKPTPGIYSSMICGFCEEGLINDAKRFLEKEENHCSPTTDTYNYLLLVYLENKCYDDVKMDEANDYCKDDKKMDDAMLIYHEMNEKGFKPNCVTYNRMIQSCFSANRFGDAHKLLDDVLAQGQTLYTNTYCDILHDLLQKELLAEALSLYDLLGEDSKLNSNTSIIEVLLDGLFDCGELDFVRELFKGLSARGIKPTPGIYSLMICGFCEEGLINDAKRFLEKEENHCSPTTDTYNYLLLVYLENKCYDDVK
nr:hypothetical protein [Tanacetum cinerariifolium]